MSEAAAPAEPVVDTPAPEPAANPASSANPANAEVATPASTVIAAAATATETPPVAVQANWPDDWRDKLAGEDKGYRTLLDRYADPGALAKAHRELQLKLSKGELRGQMPENASDEERLAWRKENGIPDKPENYDIRMPEGVVLGEAEKGMLDSFKGVAHQLNLPPAAVNALAQWNIQQGELQAAQQREQDIARRVQTEEALRADWAGNYLVETKAVGNFMAQYFPNVATDLLAARLPDGSLVGSHPDIIRGLANLRREINPMASLVPAGTSDPIKAGAARLAELTAMQKTHEGQQEYWRGPNAQALQQEMRDLLEAQERMKGRAA